MKLEYTTTLQVLDGSEIKSEDTNSYSDATYAHRSTANADLAAGTAGSPIVGTPLTIFPDNMTTAGFLQVSDSAPADVPAKWNLILTDSQGTKTVWDLTREFHAFGSWTNIQVQSQNTALTLEWTILGT